MKLRYNTRIKHPENPYLVDNEIKDPTYDPRMDFIPVRFRLGNISLATKIKILKLVAKGCSAKTIQAKYRWYNKRHLYRIKVEVENSKTDSTRKTTSKTQTKCPVIRKREIEENTDYHDETDDQYDETDEESFEPEFELEEEEHEGETKYRIKRQDSKRKLPSTVQKIPRESIPSVDIKSAPKPISIKQEIVNRITKNPRY